MNARTLLAAIDDIEACATIAARVGCDVATVRRVLAEAGHMPAAQLVRLCGMALRERREARTG